MEGMNDDMSIDRSIAPCLTVWPACLTTGILYPCTHSSANWTRLSAAVRERFNSRPYGFWELALLKVDIFWGLICWLVCSCFTMLLGLYFLNDYAELARSQSGPFIKPTKLGDQRIIYEASWRTTIGWEKERFTGFWEQILTIQSTSSTNHSSEVLQKWRSDMKGGFYELAEWCDLSSFVVHSLNRVKKRFVYKKNCLHYW